jgi:integrase
MILMAYRHGFRISELLALTMADVDIQSGVIYVKRLKNGFSVYHPLSEDECHALSKWLSLKK